MFKNLTPRSIAALAVVAVSFFLAGCVLTYGGTAFAHVGGFAQAPAIARLAGWLVANFGAGLWALLFLPMIWGAIVYFDERTPDLVLRLVGTVILAVSISTVAGLVHAGLWGGHVGNAVAGTLLGGGGAFRAVFAWLVTLSGAFVSTMFATDWIFHTLRRAGRTVTARPVAAIATEPAATEFLEPAAKDEDADEVEEREFVFETPRAAEASAEMDEVSGHTDDFFATPSGWEEMETEGRTVIAAPTGYRGVEFLPQSDELAIPAPMVDPSVTIAGEASAASAFHDDEFVTTEGAAFFRENPAEFRDEAEEPAETASGPDDDEVTDAVETLFAAVTEPVPGIGLPDDSPFKDEFFAADAGWPYAQGAAPAASDGASAADQMAATYAAKPSAPAPQPSEPEPASAFEDEEIVVSRIPAAAFDDALPSEPAPVVDAAPAPEPSNRIVETLAEVEAVAAETAEPETAEPEIAAPHAETPEPETAPQLSLFSEPAAPAAAESAVAVAEPVAAVANATTHEVNLALLHTMELDPLFRDAVAAVLERGRASAVVLQRQLGIGYARGIRILDQMTMAGLVGPDTPSGMRELRLTRDAWAAFSG